MKALVLSPGEVSQTLGISSTSPTPQKTPQAHFFHLFNHFIQASVLGTGDKTLGEKKSPCSK